jgi:Tol biopolymer transport system component/tRNA A-37 threonylcarbamoyl transferase component Bud32
MPLSAGSSLGPYQVLGVLGAGGMGEVYRARDTRLGREVAIKVLPADHLKDGVRRRRLVQEARSASALNHPHIVTIHEIESSDGVDFIVMEYVPGQTLDTLIPKGGMPVREVLRLAIPIADALTAAHARRIVHRDVKPTNVIVSDQGVVKVLDFGLARLVADDSDEPGETLATLTSPEPLTHSGAMAGTAAYMSPEQATGGKVDARSDIFGFGVVLYEMLTGRRPFLGTSVSEVRTAVVRDEPMAPRELVSAVPEALERIVLRCLRKDPQRRFQHMGDVKLELMELAEEADSRSSMPAAAPAPAPIAAASRGFSRWWWLLASIAVVGLAAIAVAFLARARTPTAPARPPDIAPFTTLPGQEMAPTFSPDGSQIAFGWRREGKEEGYDLYVKVTGSETLLRLTNNPSVWISPAWSPDGRLIAYSRMAKAGKDGSGVYVVPALGGQERKLSGLFAQDPRRFLSWSPDGTLLARPTLGAVHLLNVATLESRPLPAPAAECQTTMTAAFSPDGESLASVCLVNQGVFAIFAQPVSGAAARKLAVVHGGVDGLSYAPDGTHLIYANRGDLWRLWLSGGLPERILAGRDAFYPALARSGRRLAYTQQVTNTNIWRVGLAERLRAEGPPVSLISSSRRQQTPAFSPDGRRIAFASNRSGAGEIWICNADGSDPMALTSFGDTGSPSWSPDGNEIAFDSGLSGDAEIFVVRVDGGVPRRIDTGVRNSSVPSWSRDGKWLYFCVENARTVQVYKMPYPGGPAVALTTRGGYWPRGSADGRRVYYASQGELWSVSVTGGDEGAVPGFPRFARGLVIDWMAVPGGIYFMDGTGASPAIAFFDLATKRVHRIVDIPGPPELWVGGLAVSPDGRSILYSQQDSVSADIMLVENFE